MKAFFTDLDGTILNTEKEISPGNRAAVEEAYKAGLVQRMFLPVTMQNILDKLAACQPLDSDEYRAIEDEIVRQFRDGFDELEHLMDETAE